MSKAKALHDQSEIMEKILGHKKIVGAQSVSEKSASIFVMQNALEGHERSKISFFGTGIKRINDDDYRAAVYVQRKQDMDSELVKEAEEMSNGEAIIEYVGMVTTTENVKQMAAISDLLVGRSIGHTSITAGTLGLFVKDNQTNETLILSNNHVLANNNQANIGDDIVSPGPIDGGRLPADLAGNLVRFVDVQFGTGGLNHVDGALCSIDAGRDIAGNFVTGVPGLPTNTIIRSDVNVAAISENVHKVGRTTGATSGEVTDTNVHIYVDAGGIIASYSDQIAISSSTGRFSAGGDSGSAILNDNADVVGLLFAGSPDGGKFGTGVTFANPIHRVFDELDIRL